MTGDQTTGPSGLRPSALEKYVEDPVARTLALIATALVDRAFPLGLISRDPHQECFAFQSPPIRNFVLLVARKMSSKSAAVQ